MRRSERFVLNGTPIRLLSAKRGTMQEVARLEPGRVCGILMLRDGLGVAHVAQMILARSRAIAPGSTRIEHEKKQRQAGPRAGVYGTRTTKMTTKLVGAEMEAWDTLMDPWNLLIHSWRYGI